MTRVLTLVGSLRAASVNRRLAEVARDRAPEGVELVLQDGLADLPFYDEDLDVAGATPAAVEVFRSALDEADALLVVTPANNGTIPAVLKNAIDWASRPFRASALTGKPTAVIGSSLGGNGGASAHGDARRSLSIAGANVVEDVVLAIPGSTTRFAELDPADDTETTAALDEALLVLVDAIPAPADA